MRILAAVLTLLIAAACALAQSTTTPVKGPANRYELGATLPYSAEHAMSCPAPSLIFGSARTVDTAAGYTNKVLQCRPASADSTTTPMLQKLADRYEFTKTAGRYVFEVMLLCSADLMDHFGRALAYHEYTTSCPDTSLLFGSVCTVDFVARTGRIALQCRSGLLDGLFTPDVAIIIKLHHYEVDLEHGDTCLLLAPDTYNTARHAILIDDTLQYYRPVGNDAVKKMVVARDEVTAAYIDMAWHVSQPISVFLPADDALRPCTNDEYYEMRGTPYLILTCPLPRRDIALDAARDALASCLDKDVYLFGLRRPFHRDNPIVPAWLRLRAGRSPTAGACLVVLAIIQ
jgi:hypothetical protein